MDVSIPGERITNIDKLLRDRDINYQVTGEQSKKVRCPTPVLRPTNVFSSNRAMDWKDFHSLTVIYNAMETLEAKYPSICTVSNIGKSVEGRDIKMLRITNSDTRNKAVWLDGGIHAREWIAVSVVAYIAHQFATNYSALPEYVTNKDWYFVPVVNPDGYHYTHTSDRLWRKNRARVENTPCGVDLNRNFGYGWGKTKNDAYEDPNHINYQGSEAFSEPETKAIREVILNSNIRFKIFLTFHAYSEVISFPWCNSTEPCPDYVDLLEGATVMAKAVYDTHKRVYKVGNFRNIMYYATGTSIDWSYGSAKIPFSYLFELRSKHHKFLLSKEEILPCCEEALSGVKALAKFVEQKKQYFSHSRLKM
ncbi:carboxypeptidase B-like [Aricia agestis]|uniref:carboxypeptidase B-like n=1 Tax=Aricia agestis TaxID=91739 RepID=UPI001C20B6DB|nr:carboxypeptidase B-like [Aricia agestis]